MLFIKEHIDAYGKLGNTVKFMFSPKGAKTFNYKISSNDTTIDQQTGRIVAYLTPQENKLHPDPNIPNWWTATHQRI